MLGDGGMRKLTITAHNGDNEGVSITHDVSAISLRISNKAYSDTDPKFIVMRDIALDIKNGEFIAFVGPSGCGKTTLLRMIAGLDLEYKGQIEAFGVPVSGTSRKRGIVFQELRLLPWFTVEQNLLFALPNGSDNTHGVNRAEELLNLIGLERFSKLWPRQLSGGMEKRVALARSLMNVPEILLLDEPFGALDSITRYTLQEEIAQSPRII